MSILERQGGYCVKLYIKGLDASDESKWLFNLMWKYTSCINCHHWDNNAMVRCTVAESSNLVIIPISPVINYLVCVHWRSKGGII